MLGQQTRLPSVVWPLTGKLYRKVASRGVGEMILLRLIARLPTSLPDLLLLCTWKLGIQPSRRRAPKTFAVLSASITPNTNAT